MGFPGSKGMKGAKVKSKKIIFSPYNIRTFLMCGIASLCVVFGLNLLWFLVIDPWIFLYFFLFLLLPEKQAFSNSVRLRALAGNQRRRMTCTKPSFIVS